MEVLVSVVKIVGYFLLLFQQDGMWLEKTSGTICKIKSTPSNYVYPMDL